MGRCEMVHSLFSILHCSYVSYGHVFQLKNTLANTHPHTYTHAHADTHADTLTLTEYIRLLKDMWSQACKFEAMA